jgi:hypothetical protein
LVVSESLIDPDELRRAIFDDAELERLIVAWGLDEVRLAVTDLASLIRMQFETKEEKSRDWKARAGFMLNKTNERVRLLRLRVSERNRAETATVDAAHKKWSTFAENVARALYLIDPAALKEIPGPDGAHDITAEEWLHDRVAQRARKQAAS